MSCNESFSCRNCISLHKSHTCIAGPTGRKRRSNVLSACIHCKEAHTACDVSRPCSRCISLNMTESCQDISQRKRGRPKRQEKPADRNKAYSHTTKKTYSKETQLELSSQKIYKEQPLFTKPIPSQKINYEQQVLIDPILSQNIHNDQQASLIVKPMVNSLLEQHPSIALPSSKKELCIILSMDIECIDVPKDIYALWGYQSSELINRSLYDFVLKKDIDRLLQHHLAHINPLSDKKLDKIHIRKKSGEYEPFELTTYRQDDKMDKQVIVARFKSYKTNRERIPKFNMAVGATPSHFSLTYSSDMIRPAYQYYLETLSSELSVEASVLKSHNELSPYRYSQGPLRGPCKKSDMSINSLLC